MNINLENNATVVTAATLEGNISIGSYTVVHPHAIIKSGDGQIIIGKNNIIEEGVLIENKGPPGSVMIIGDDNIFKVKSTIYANQIGNNNVFGIKSIIGEGTSITNLCSICPYGEYYIQYEPLRENTVIYNGDFDQRTSSETATSIQLHAEVLRKLLLNFHRGYTKTAKPK
jgi:carbonic anhydrase/acetyltransferase-like protein (isoleucine patch superfamily)